MKANSKIKKNVGDSCTSYFITDYCTKKTALCRAAVIAVYKKLLEGFIVAHYPETVNYLSTNRFRISTAAVVAIPIAVLIATM
jgi:hypothetical protein